MTISLETKIQAIFEYSLTRSLRSISKKYSIGKSTLQRWIHQCTLRQKQYKFTNHIARQRVRLKIITESIQFTIQDALSRHPFLTLFNLRTLIKKTHSVTVSTETIRRCIKQCGITRKRAKTTVLKSKTYFQQLQDKRSLFLESYRLLSPTSIISIDETAIHANLHPLYGYGTKGKRVQIPLRTMKSCKYSVLMAMSSEKIERVQYTPGNYNAIKFRDFIHGLLETLENRGQYVFLLDNVAFHKRREIQNMIIHRGHRLLFTPPYSPDTNPIEHAFSVLKNKIRRDFGKPFSLIMHCITYFQIPKVNLLNMIRRSQNTRWDTIPPELFRWIPS